MNVNIVSVCDLLNDAIKQRFQVTMRRAPAAPIIEFKLWYMGQLLVHASLEEDAGPEAIEVSVNKFLDECREMLDKTFIKQDETK